MKTVEAVQVEGSLRIRTRRAGDGEARAVRVQVGIAVRNYDVEAVCCAPLEDADERFLALAGRGVGEDGAAQEAGAEAGHADRGQGDGAVFQEESSGDAHGNSFLILKTIVVGTYLRWNSGEPRRRAAMVAGVAGAPEAGLASFTNVRRVEAVMPPWRIRSESRSMAVSASMLPASSEDSRAARP